MTRLTFAFLTLLLPTVALAQLDDKCVLLECAECDCYWSSECGDGKSCDYGSGCTHVGKKDGTCKSAGSSGGLTPQEVRASAAAFGLWLEAYQTPTPDKGLPSIDHVKRIDTLSLSATTQRRVQNAAFNALDVLLGFDFGHPRGDCNQYDARCLGILRIAPDKNAVRLLRAVQPALVAALESGDRAPLKKALNTYWKKYPSFRPHHSGRCYPHGHREYPYKAIAQCQIDELTRIVDDLLPRKGY